MNNPINCQVTYTIEFKDELGWYCPGDPWCNPDTELLQEWRNEIKKCQRLDVRIIAYINGKIARHLSILH